MAPGSSLVRLPCFVYNAPVLTHLEPERASARMEQDKLALRASSAGMRFIAQTHLYNSGDPQRLRQFIADSYHATLLDEESVDQRLDTFQTFFNQIGRMKVKQVLAANKEHVIVILEAEKDAGFFYSELKVEDDYPHHILLFMLVKMRAVDE